MKNHFILLLFATVLVGCLPKKKKESYQYTKDVTKQSENMVEIPEGKKIMEQRCFVCHNTTTPHDSRIAPPMIAIKAFYIKENTSKEAFIKEFVGFTKNPTIEQSKMKKAVKRFGLMPSQGFSEEELTKIATYIYDYKIEEPTWFKEHWKEKHGTSYINSGKKITVSDENKSLEEIGLEYALGTKKVLGKNLMGKIQKEGTLEALKFCNHKAYSLTDSMATKFDAVIKRVSDKPRNEKNQANEKELEIIDKYKRLIAEKKEIKPIIEENDLNVQFYYPIKTNSMCMQCHGKPNDEIKLNTIQKLAELYPKDKAKGYSVNQVRGIWSINFKK